MTSCYGVALPAVIHAEVDPPAPGGRIIVVGDVHGCCDELEELLERLAPTDDDLVIFAGDLVNKGPRNPDVLRLVRERGYPSVRGNHDDVVLARLADRRAAGAGVAVESDRPGQPWMDELTPEDEQLLRELPFTIRVRGRDVLVVHAGLVPGVPLEEQDPSEMFTMRDLLSGSGSGGWTASSKKGTGVAWATEWPGPELVVFGHDAQRGLQREAHAVGLDTGCVYGNELTALVLGPDGEQEVVAVAAKQVWSKPKGRVGAGSLSSSGSASSDGGWSCAIL